MPYFICHISYAIWHMKYDIWPALSSLFVDSKVHPSRAFFLISSIFHFLLIPSLGPSHFGQGFDALLPFDRRFGAQLGELDRRDHQFPRGRQGGEFYRPRLRVCPPL